MRLIISEEVRMLLEERAIRDVDVARVIRAAEKTRCKLEHRITGRHLAHLRLSGVTYWVQYKPENDGYRIFTAYSHRMEILEECQM
ncbi:MAG: hypothetical protein WAN11_00680 [Syntrophobacteraceae bacterium]